MCRILFISCLLSICFSSVYSQDIRDRIVIKEDVVIINQDTLVIDKTGIDDVLTRFQIDSLGPPCKVHWDGSGDSGTYYEYRIKRKNYKANYRGTSQIAFILNTISIKSINNISLFFGNIMVDNILTHKDIQDLGFKKEQRYEQKKSETLYKREGIHLKIDETSDSLSIKSIHIHPKSWDKHLKLKILKGEVSNNKGELLPSVMFLAYNKYDSLKYYETTDINGKYYFEFDNAQSIEISKFNYESQILRSLDNKDQTINFKLKKKTYFLPDLIVTKKGKIEIDSTFYLEQFPKVKDASKINVWLWRDFTDYNPLDCRIPSAGGDLKNIYRNLVESLSRKKKLRKCTAEIYLTIDENGQTKIEDITCGDKVDKEFLAKSIIENLKWAPAEWIGRRIDSNWSLKIIFE